MVKMKKDSILFNKYFWTFINLITSCPEKYLNKNGKIIYKVVVDGGSCNSITKIAKQLNIHISEASVLCHKLLDDTQHIVLFKDGNKQAVQFSSGALKDGEDIISVVSKK